MKPKLESNSKLSDNKSDSIYAESYSSLHKTQLSDPNYSYLKNGGVENYSEAKQKDSEEYEGSFINFHSNSHHNCFGDTGYFLTRLDRRRSSDDSVDQSDTCDVVVFEEIEDD